MKKEKRVPRIRTNINVNWIDSPTRCEVREFGESQTVPDMSMSVQEIMMRFASGRPLSFSRNLVFTGDDFTPDLRAMDISEIHELQEENLAHIRQLNDEINERREKRRQAKMR
ncbi:MAG: hypothetical protein QXT80_04105, partial [Thermoplasmatales archaeon]